ncbi:hypothetical protein PR048_001432 [Dryococelus australis]|uniref:Uncharacterized protein n=1 Tax=Dryococelus australis TaxID=614101 RepID=A0ABQ9IHC7_9NEOP|nr:hypothetical protein PR048_001432 [Dryococelus australis]
MKEEATIHDRKEDILVSFDIVSLFTNFLSQGLRKFSYITLIKTQQLHNWFTSVTTASHHLLGKRQRKSNNIAVILLISHQSNQVHCLA